MRAGQTDPALASQRLLFGQKGAGNDQTLNLVGAFINLSDLGIAHHTFSRILFHVPIATKNLNGIVGHFDGGIGGKHFGHGRVLTESSRRHDQSFQPHYRPASERPQLWSPYRPA